MDLSLNSAHGDGYINGSQIARRITEDWVLHNGYCVACASPTLGPTPPNTKAVDFKCRSCLASYQLKSRRNWSDSKVADAGYDAMIGAIRSDSVPNLLVMQYTPSWTVRNLLLIPSFFVAESAVQKRNPLSPTARRAGWVGCNIILSNIAPEGKLRIVSDGLVTSPAIVRDWYTNIRPIAKISTEARGWALDVLAEVRKLGVGEFTLDQIYGAESRLSQLHPNNNNIRPKIRQQLQVLRDIGLVTFLDRGKYRLTGPGV